MPIKTYYYLNGKKNEEKHCHVSIISYLCILCETC